MEYNKRNLLEYLGENGMSYATTIDETKEWGVLQRRVAVFCKEGRVKGVELLGRTWFIPKEAKKRFIHAN